MWIELNWIIKKVKCGASVLTAPVGVLPRIPHCLKHMSLLNSCSCMSVFHSRNSYDVIIVVIIIIIIIKRGRQCKADREWCTPCQFQDASPTVPTYRPKVEKGKTVEDKRELAALANKKTSVLILKTTSLTPSNTGSGGSFKETMRWEKKYCEVLQRRGA